MAIATRRPLQNAGLGANTLFHSETPHPQNREECDLCDEPCGAVEDHITERTGP